MIIVHKLVRTVCSAALAETYGSTLDSVLVTRLIHQLVSAEALCLKEMLSRCKASQIMEVALSRTGVEPDVEANTDTNERRTEQASESDEEGCTQPQPVSPGSDTPTSGWDTAVKSPLLEAAKNAEMRPARRSTVVTWSMTITRLSQVIGALVTASRRQERPASTAPEAEPRQTPRESGSKRLQPTNGYSTFHGGGYYGAPMTKSSDLMMPWKTISIGNRGSTTLF